MPVRSSPNTVAVSFWPWRRGVVVLLIIAHLALVDRLATRATVVEERGSL